jgi:malonate-semialdehyde dehydrogenase (acetylating)/methylmalonate-semialdehyde dehydrogenase
VAAAARAFQSWSRTPVMERVRLMFRFKELLERHFEELARLVTLHHGKTLEEARGRSGGALRWWTSLAARPPFSRAGP